MSIIKFINVFPSVFAASVALFCIFPLVIYLGDGLWSGHVRAAAQVSIGPTFNIIRRPMTEVSGALVEYHESRLTHKLNRRVGVRKLTKSDEISKVKRKIIPPVSPTQPLSAGIFQDGNDYSYFAQVQLGSKSSVMYMLLDTGAAMSWVMGNNCINPICTSRNTFGPQNSSSIRISGDTFYIGYGSGECSGDLAEENINFAGLTVRMPIGLANNVSDDFGNFEMYGILGLSAAKSEVPSFLDSIVRTKTLKQNMFGISLSQMKDGTNTGVINFGSPDPSRFTGDLKYYPISSSENDWKITLASVGIDDKQVPVNQSALLDTGTSYIFAPLEDATKIHALVPESSSADGGNNWQVPCDTTSDLVFTLGSDKYSIPPTVWIGPPISGGQCRSNLAGFTSDQWVLGDYFLKNYYVVFDVDGKRIGLASAKIPNSPLAPTSSTGSNPAGVVPTQSSGPLTVHPGEGSDNFTIPPTSDAKRSDAYQIRFGSSLLVVLMGAILCFT